MQVLTFNGAATCSLRNAGARDGRVLYYAVPSMGPQHVRCGMVYALVICGAAARAFNGAATCSLRNDLVDEPPQRVGDAPSMGPQHVRCGMKDAGFLTVIKTHLQWGRNMFVAE